MKDEFVCTNEIFLIFQFLVQLRPKFSISICDSLKENSILHLLVFFFYSQHQFFIRKVFIFSKLNSSARMKFSIFFTFLCGWDPNSQSQFVTVWKRTQFYISSFPSSTFTTNLLQEKFSFSQSSIRLHEWNFPYFSVSSAGDTQILDLNLWEYEREFNSASARFLLLLSARIFHKKNFHFLKDEFVCTNEIFLIFQLLVRLTHKFSISICDSLKENSILHVFVFFFYSQHEFFIRKIFIFWKLNSSASIQFSLSFRLLCGSDRNSRSEFVTVWKIIQFCISSFSSSTLSTNFS